MSGVREFEGKCRLLPKSAVSSQVQQDALYSASLNIRVQTGNEPASCKADPGGSKKENPGALAGATGADIEASLIDSEQHTIRPDRSSTPAERAIAIMTAWHALTDWEACHFADYIFAEVRGHEPIPPLNGILAEARQWADFTSPSELDAYALAAFERMGPPRQAAFLAHVGRIAA